MNLLTNLLKKDSAGVSGTEDPQALPDDIAVRLTNVYKGYRTNKGYKPVLKGLNFSFPKQKNIGIMGRNGSGKSTLLQLIFGRLFPDSGFIDIARNQTMSWPIGGACLKGNLTARENIKFVCRIYDVDIDYGVDFVEDFAEFGIYMDMPVHTFSSGMKARLAFALGAMIEFDCYLVDEGFNTGDSKLAENMRARFLDEPRQSNLILVSHNSNLIKRFCDGVAVMVDGQLHYHEDVIEGIKHYKSL